jgi:hypothetical protein
VPPEAAAALDYVWTSLWDMDPERMPMLIAVRGKDLNCKDGRGWVSGDGRCFAGSHSGESITVAFPEAVPLHETALNHEAAHQRLDVELGRRVGDSEAHGREDFQAWIREANAALAARQGVNDG